MQNQEVYDELMAKFEKLYGVKPAAVAYAPGRIEVLGNHMTTVQKIAGLLGENAAYTDATLRSIIEAYDRGVEEIPTKHPSEE